MQQIGLVKLNFKINVRNISRNKKGGIAPQHPYSGFV